MIPHRILTSEVCGGGLRDRVIACRKRLRHSRVAHPTAGNIGVSDGVRDLFPETAPSVSGFNEYAAGCLPECPAISTPAVRPDYRSPFPLAAAEEGESRLLAGEQGVGIT